MRNPGPPKGLIKPPPPPPPPPARTMTTGFFGFFETKESKQATADWYKRLNGKDVE